MPDSPKHAIYLFPQALETLGEAVAPYLQDGPHGPHFLCTEIDSGGPLFRMTVMGQGGEGQLVETEILIPSAMVRLVLSTQPELEIGYV